LPIPWNPEAGFGAVTGDGAVVLNEPLVNAVGLTKKDIEEVKGRVMEVLRHREQIFREELPSLDIYGKHAIVVDDGVASGYTMLAAVMSTRNAGVRRVTIAVPVASEPAVRLLRDSVDEFICLIESHRLPFAVAEYYLNWRDLSEEEVLQYLSQARRERSKSQL
jgi:predicted phosphoribosyltransferase